MTTHLDHHVPLEVILKTLQLKLQDWREVSKKDSFAGILQHDPMSASVETQGSTMQT